MKSPLIAVKAIDHTGKVQSLRSRKIKRIYHFIQTAKSSDFVFELRVTYQSGFINEGAYKTAELLIGALKAFTEKS